MKSLTIKAYDFLSNEYKLKIDNFSLHKIADLHYRLDMMCETIEIVIEGETHTISAFQKIGMKKLEYSEKNEYGIYISCSNLIKRILEFHPEDSDIPASLQRMRYIEKLIKRRINNEQKKI